jgi:gluconokinase
MIIVLMGVSGSGKTTVGKELARQLGWSFYDADDYHPAVNLAKMRAGVPLTDEDRLPWLQTLARLIDVAELQGEDVVLACSALKQAYRDHLAREGAAVNYVFLSASPELIRRRLEARRGHFMNTRLLASQLETLELPAGAIRIDVGPGPEVIAAEVRRGLRI